VNGILMTLTCAVICDSNVSYLWVYWWRKHSNFQLLVFLVAAGLVLLALYKEHSTGKAGEVYLLFITICPHTTTILLFL
jgi:hypothetical protein